MFLGPQSTLITSLKSILNKIISSAQSASILGHLISNNIIMGHKCLHTIRNSKLRRQGWAAIKLDISKTYDKVVWVFLNEIMLKLGFDPSWISLILDCISSVNFSILLNEPPKGSFMPNRGLRQDDPLSPYLFLLIIEDLSSLLQEAKARGTIRGIKCAPSSPQVSHLLFTDDSLVFCRADKTNYVTLKRLLKLYEEASGEVLITPSLLCFFSPNINSDRGLFLSNILGIKMQDSLGTYLVLPSSFSRSKTKDFQGIIDKVWKAVHGWKKSFFSMAGKEALIKSVGQAPPTYSMSLFQLPQKLCEGISRSFSRYPHRRRERYTGKAGSSFAYRSP